MPRLGGTASRVRAEPGVSAPGRGVGGVPAPPTRALICLDRGRAPGMRTPGAGASGASTRLAPDLAHADSPRATAAFRLGRRSPARGEARTRPDPTPRPRAALILLFLGPGRLCPPSSRPNDALRGPRRRALIGMHPYPSPAPNASPTPHDTPSQGHSLRDLKLQAGLSVRQIADRTRIHYRRVARVLSERGRPRRRELRVLRQCLDNELRRRRSSDPGFLRSIQEVAVPFLHARLRPSGDCAAGEDPALHRGSSLSPVEDVVGGEGIAAGGPCARRNGSRQAAGAPATLFGRRRLSGKRAPAIPSRRSHPGNQISPLLCEATTVCPTSTAEALRAHAPAPAPERNPSE